MAEAIGAPDFRFAIAPMMDWTDRHYRLMARLLTRRAQLWTEMVVDNTLLYQVRDRYTHYYLQYRYSHLTP